VKVKLVAAAAAVLMAACGGGGGGSDDGGPGVDAQGFWDGEDFSALITPSGEVWVVEDYGVDGLLLSRGSISSSSGNSISGSMQSYFADGTLNSTISATVAPGSSLSGTVTAQGFQPNTFSATYNTAYDQPALLSNLAGTWAVEAGSVVFDAQGAFTAVQDGCNTAGQVTPDSSGKNFFRATVNYGAGCGPAQGLTATGIVVTDGQVMAVGLVGGGTGAALIAERQ
jgi:hypothetical protein